MYHAARGDVAASPRSQWTTTPWRRPWLRTATKLEAAAEAMSPAPPLGDNICDAVVADADPRVARTNACHRAFDGVASLIAPCLTLLRRVAPHKRKQQQQQQQQDLSAAM